MPVEYEWLARCKFPPWSNPRFINRSMPFRKYRGKVVVVGDSWWPASKVHVIFNQLDLAYNNVYRFHLHTYLEDTGVAEAAKYWAAERRVLVFMHALERYKYGESAEQKRNQQIVDQQPVCYLFFINNESRMAADLLFRSSQYSTSVFAYFAPEGKWRSGAAARLAIANRNRENEQIVRRYQGPDYRSRLEPDWDRHVLV